MRKLTIVLAGVLFLAVSLQGQEANTDTAQELFRRALALHDAGDYDGAIAIYRDLLAKMPDNEQVKYELTFSTFAKGDMTETVRLATAGAGKPGSHQVHYLELLGNAYDAQHKTPDAIAAYRRGIKVDPKYPRIHFNLGVAYSGQNKLRDAREEFEQAIALDPGYASPQIAIAEVYRTDGYRVPAILAYGRFLSLESSTNRATTAARYLQALLNLGVKAQGQGNVNITIDPNTKKDLGDFSALEMMAALASGASHLSEKEKMSEFDREADTLASFLAMFSESSGDLRHGFIKDTYAPFYRAMVKDGQSSAFAHTALAALKLPGTDEWFSSHQGDVAALKQWLQRFAKQEPRG
jgi:tetratricopeptide (TPR) repeat protein